MNIFRSPSPNSPLDGNYSKQDIFVHPDLQVTHVIWGSGAFSKVHSHDSDGNISGYVIVLEGIIRNAVYTHIDGKLTPSWQDYRQGECIPLPLGTVHKMQNLTKIAKTLHFYSPSIEKMITFDDTQVKTLSQAY